LPKKYPPLTPQQVIDILKARGFKFNNQVGSHAQYEGKINNSNKKVTVDMSEKDFDDELIKSMIDQSGLNRNEFYCSTPQAAKKINKRVKKIKPSIETA
jgi:predicted RNA binding protein YcfA (HicA-like mRNA interferase family)